MSDLIQQITSDLQQKIDTFRPEYDVRDVGTVDEAGDGIARVKGLSKVRSQELVEFANGVMGIAFNLEEDTVGVIILGDYATVKEGMSVYTTGRIASVPVGNALIARVGPISESIYAALTRRYGAARLKLLYEMLEQLEQCLTEKPGAGNDGR